MLPPTSAEPLLLTSDLISLWQELLAESSSAAGKSVTLRILAERLAAQRDVTVGVLSRPQASIHDFFRELGSLFGVQLSPHNRWAGC